MLTSYRDRHSGKPLHRGLLQVSKGRGINRSKKKNPTFIFKMKNRKTKKKIDRWTDGEIDKRRDGYGQT